MEPPRSGNAIAEHQIYLSKLRSNARNLARFPGLGLPLDSLDPTRPQDDSEDPSIQYIEVEGAPYHASYNAELFKQLTPEMIEVMKRIA